MTPNSVPPLYLIINNSNGYVEDSNLDTYSTLVSTDETKDKLKKWEEIWTKTKSTFRLKIFRLKNSGDKMKKILKSISVQLMIYFW